MSWIGNITDTIIKQNEMCELSIHNGKVILMDSSKVYDIKVGKMLKTSDNRYVSKKVINNTKNKLYWRHLYSYLNQESIEMINQMIYQYKMKSEVLRIENIVYFGRNYQLENIVGDIYDCKTTGINPLTNRWGWNMNNLDERMECKRREKIQEKEDWIDISINKEDLFNSSKFKMRFWKNCHIKFNQNIKDTNKKSKHLQKNISGDLVWFNMSDYCNGVMGNGDFCGCECNETLNTDRHYFNNQINKISFNEDGGCNMNNRYIGWNWYNDNKNRNNTKISLCKRHYNKYEKMNEKDYCREVDKIYKKMGYELKNGYMCKSC